MIVAVILLCLVLIGGTPKDIAHIIKQLSFLTCWSYSKNCTALLVVCGVKTLTFVKLLENCAIMNLKFGFSFPQQTHVVWF